VRSDQGRVVHSLAWPDPSEILLSITADLSYEASAK
jgi:hypothetical protein